MVLLGTDTTSFADFHSHGTADNVATGQVLGGRRVPFHEALTFRVSQNTTFSTATFRHETTGSVDSSGMELHKLIVLTGKSLAHGHGVSVAGAGVCRSAGKVGSPVATRGQDGIFGLDTMNGTVLHVHGHDADAGSVVIHDKIKGKVFDKVCGIKGEGTSVESVQHGVSGAVGGGGTTVRLSSLAEFE